MKWPHRYLIIVPEMHVGDVYALFQLLQIEVNPSASYCNENGSTYWIIHTAATEQHLLELDTQEQAGRIPNEVLYFRYDFEDQILRKTNCTTFDAAINQPFDCLSAIEQLGLSASEETLEDE